MNFQTVKIRYLVVVAVPHTAVAGIAVAAVVAAAADTVVAVVAAAVADTVVAAVAIVVVVAIDVAVVVVVHAVDCTFFQTVVEEFVFLLSLTLNISFKKYQFFCFC